MELRVFDKTVQPLGAIDELPSLIWHTKYFDVGTFSLLAPITDNNSRLPSSQPYVHLKKSPSASHQRYLSPNKV